MTGLLGAMQFLWGRVETTDTAEATLIEEAKKANYTEEEARQGLKLMLSAGQIVKGRAEGTYQRWHGEVARDRSV